MKQSVRRGLWWGGLLSLAVAVAWAQTARPPAAAKSTLERLKIAVAPLGWDTNFTWLQTRSGMLDKRPALEYLVGIDRYTGAYIPELAEKWVMSPDGKGWTVTLRQGIPFHEHWGEFTARDVRHAVFLISQPEAAASDTGIWRSVMGSRQSRYRRRGGQESRTGRGDPHQLRGRLSPPASGARVSLYDLRQR